MMKHAMWVAGVTAIVAVIGTAAFAHGWGPGVMNPQMMQPGMMGPGYGSMSGAQPTGPALPVEQAIVRARQFVAAYGNANLAPVEVIEFSTTFYVVVQDKNTGKPAFALLVNRYNGNVVQEMGAPMMWNTTYGHRMRRGLHTMGPGSGPGFGPRPGVQPAPGTQPAPGAQPTPGALPSPGARPVAPQLDETKARAALQAWVNRAFPGAGIGAAIEFPGYFTYRLTRDGKTFALASVNAYTGQVWYAWQFGTVVREQVIQ